MDLFHFFISHFSLPFLGEVGFILFATLLMVSYYHMTFSRVGRLLRKFPGAPVFPLIGSTYLFFGPPERLKPNISWCLKTYGPRFRMWKLQTPYLILADARDIEALLTSHDHVNKGSDYAQLHWLHGNGLLTSPSRVWRGDRKLLTPAFKFARFGGFLDSFNKNSKVFCDILRNKYFPKGDEKRDLQVVISKYTMDTVFENVFGTPLNIQGSVEGEDDAVGNRFYVYARKGIEAYRNRILKPWMAFPILRNLNGVGKLEADVKAVLTEEMSKVIQKRMENFNFNDMDSISMEEKDAKAFIDILITGGKSREVLLEQAFTIYAAGFETNATAIQFTLFLLALNPSCQEKVHEELDLVFGDDLKRDATFKDLGDLKYLELVILESLRIFPPAPLFSRRLTTDLVLHDGAVVPKGTDAAIFVCDVHTDPQYFPEPGKFKPERFLEKLKHPYSYLPFSKGPRGCIGQKYGMVQLKTLLSHVLREFQVSSKMKMEDINIVYGVVTEVDREILMTLTPRNKGVVDEVNNNTKKGDDKCFTN